jgi:hypothetical protein
MQRPPKSAIQPRSAAPPPSRSAMGNRCRELIKEEPLRQIGASGPGQHTVVAMHCCCLVIVKSVGALPNTSIVLLIGREAKFSCSTRHFTSLMRLPQRGHGKLALPCRATQRQSRTSALAVSPTRSRSGADYWPKLAINHPVKLAGAAEIGCH